MLSKKIACLIHCYKWGFEERLIVVSMSSLCQAQRASASETIRLVQTLFFDNADVTECRLLKGSTNC